MKVLQPPIARLSHIQLEQASVDKFFNVYFAHGSFEDLCAVIELSY